MRSVQNLAAEGVLPSAAQYRRDWTFDETALRRYVAEREQAAREKAKVRIKAFSQKKPIDGAPSHGLQAEYERALGIKPGQPRRKGRKARSTAAKPTEGND